jgi:hypothetical protein
MYRKLYKNLLTPIRPTVTEEIASASMPSLSRSDERMMYLLAMRYQLWSGVYQIYGATVGAYVTRVHIL